MSNKAAILKTLAGKTIKSVTVERTETADSCVFASFELHFTDKSMFSFQLRAMPAVEGVFFPSEEDDDSEGAVLVKP